MPTAVSCAGCAAPLAVPAAAAGKVLRCPRCGGLNPLPADPAPEPPRWTRARREPEWDDRDDEPRSREPAAVPAWAWAVAGTVAVVGAAVVLALVLTQHDPDPAPPVAPPPVVTAPPAAAPAVTPETWVARTHASGATWEFPTTGEQSATTAAVRFAGGKTLTFTVTVKDVPVAGRPDLLPVNQLRAAAPGGVVGVGRVESVRTVAGRPAVVVRVPNFSALYAAEPGRTYEFRVAPPALDEGGERTRRFFDSVRLTRPMPPDPGTPAAGGAPDPLVWTRRFLPGGTFSVEVPEAVPAGNGTATLPPGEGRVAAVQSRLTFPDGRDMRFSVTANLVASGRDDPAGLIEMDVDAFRTKQRGLKLVRRLTVEGRPGYVAARSDAKAGSGAVHVRVQDGATSYALIATGFGFTAETPEVRRFIESARFDLRPPAAPAPPAAGPAAPPAAPPAPAPGAGSRP